MSRNVADFTIDNDTGANVRSQLNNLLNDIKTLNAAAGDITDKDAYQLFVNTTDGRWKIIDSNGTTVREIPIDISADNTITAHTLTGSVTYADGTIKNTAGALQISEDELATTVSSTSGSWVDITGLDVNITPLNNKSKFLLILSMRGSCIVSSGALTAYYRLMRDSTPIHVGAAAGSRLQVTGNFPTIQSGDAEQKRRIYTLGGVYFDSPATAAAIDYKVQMISPDGAVIQINYDPVDTNSASFGRAASSLTVIEIGGA